ncbi:hypothetical protein N6H14_20695 [Paenibacillus sp. CC-CFT747]|nr:hypothetical protein N6H14_20695 [Paenibacillus sp. CC-CFT747]
MYTLLLVDPDPRMRKWVTDSLAWNEMGVGQVYTAPNGDMALRIAKERGPELILSEIQLPGGGESDWVKLLIREEHPHKIAFGVNGRTFIRLERPSSWERWITCLNLSSLSRWRMWWSE